MKKKLLLLDYCVLFFGTSYYLGTGWSTAITQFPIMPQLTVSNYYLHFVPQVAASTGFFNWLVPIMILTAVVMLAAQWKTRWRLIKPHAPLPLDPDLYLNRITTAGLIDMGYADAKQYLREMSPQGVAPQPETLMMNATTKPGVSFRETMTGGFSLGETDPRAGEQSGDAAGTKLSLHCDINIQDIYGFMEDPQHFAPIQAWIDFAPLGMNLPASRAIFNLFRPGEDPKTKYFVYEAAFEVNGESYYLAGKKRVHDDRGFDMWADITTLFTLLHKGKDDSGPVVGAGVIYIKREQLINLIPTIHATNTSSAAESLKVLADFGRFFMGEIWDTYSKL
jgi:hypothetical protein